MEEKAYGGDLIEVIKTSDESYKVGDVLEVEYRQSDMGACDDDCLITMEGHILFDGDYIIVKKKWDRVEMSEENGLRQYLHATIDSMTFEQLKDLAKKSGLR